MDYPGKRLIIVLFISGIACQFWQVPMEICRCLCGIPCPSIAYVFTSL